MRRDTFFTCILCQRGAAEPEIAFRNTVTAPFPDLKNKSSQLSRTKNLGSVHHFNPFKPSVRTRIPFQLQQKRSHVGQRDNLDLLGTYLVTLLQVFS